MVSSPSSYGAPPRANSPQQYREGVQYLEPRYAESRTSRATDDSYHVDRRVDLSQANVERRQVSADEMRYVGERVRADVDVAIRASVESYVKYIHVCMHAARVFDVIGAIAPCTSQSGRIILPSTQTLKYETVGHEWERHVQDVPVPVSRAEYRSIDQDRIATPTRTVTAPTSQPRSVSPVTYRPHDHALYSESYSSPTQTNRWKFSEGS
jgi:tRNA threonylcarbamoyladenosine modification (KEOPS) complex  Pcc1 subunit